MLTVNLENKTDNWVRKLYLIFSFAPFTKLFMKFARNAFPDLPIDERFSEMKRTHPIFYVLTIIGDFLVICIILFACALLVFQFLGGSLESSVNISIDTNKSLLF